MRVQDLEKMGTEEFFKKVPLNFYISEQKPCGTNFGRFIDIKLLRDEFSESDDIKFGAKLLEGKKERGIRRIDTRYEMGKDYQESIIKLLKLMFGDKKIVGDITEENSNLRFDRKFKK